MALDRPVFQVGTLTIRGGAFAFEAAKGAFEARAGDEAEVALLYTYEEASAEREDLRLKFTAELGGAALGEVEVPVRDLPLVKDVVQGNLSVLAKLAKPGALHGRFTVEARYAKGPWSGSGGGAAKHFHHVGRFDVRVR